MSGTVKLQKYIADSGLMSRRAAERLIAEGRVAVGGVTAALGDRVDPCLADVTLDGKKVTPAPDEHTYIALHKPAGIVSTMMDDEGRRTVADLTREVPARVYPIGRLDMYSDGLLLMTNDGALANALAHPRGDVAKVYRVTLSGNVGDDKLSALASPMTITEADGTRYALRPCEVSLISRGGDTIIEMTLHEGRNRQIRRMCTSLGLTVKRLTRISEGSVPLGELPPGKWRYLTNDELSALFKEAGLGR